MLFPIGNPPRPRRRRRGSRMDIKGIGKGIGDLFALMCILILVFVPLGIWKLVDIVLWLFNNISVVIK